MCEHPEDVTVLSTGGYRGETVEVLYPSGQLHTSRILETHTGSEVVVTKTNVHVGSDKIA